MVGWLISLRVQEFSYLEITEYVSATQIKVKGNAEDLALASDRYWLFAPPHVDPATGAIRGTRTLAGDFVPECDTHYLWGLYRYMPPMVGFEVDLDGDFGGVYSPTVYGAQTGANQAGHYHAGARDYDPSIGRWTTPDPLLSNPNVASYADGKPMSLLDPSGLSPKEG